MTSGKPRLHRLAFDFMAWQDVEPGTLTVLEEDGAGMALSEGI